MNTDIIRDKQRKYKEKVHIRSCYVLSNVIQSSLKVLLNQFLFFTGFFYTSRRKLADFDFGRFFFLSFFCFLKDDVYLNFDLRAVGCTY